MNNIFEGFSNTLKSKFCEFQSSTFSISFVISAIFVNHKYLMIYYSNIDPDRKLLMLEYQGINLWLPILFALLYVYLYPYAAKEFYSRTLEFSNEFKKTKVDKLSKRIIDEDDAKSFVAEIEKLSKKLDEQTQFVLKMEREYTVKIEKLKNLHMNEVAQCTLDMQNKESKYKQEISELTSTIDKMSSTANTLEAKVRLVELENEKHKFENQKRRDEASQLDSEKRALLLNGINTTDEMILREINRLGETDIPSLLQKFHDINENSLTVKMQKLRQEGKIITIGNTQYYCLTDVGKRILNLK